MGLKIVLVIFSVMLIISMLALYWFLIPLGNPIEFMSKPKSSNFSLSANATGMQFYPNMRYLNPSISYRIESCSQEREDNMVAAFEEISAITLLEFYPVDFGEEIIVTCDERTLSPQEKYFIAGEGGPTKIIAGEKFNLIYNGKILLFRDSACDVPNIAIHELLHALGFEHSLNKKNIMYNITDCGQTFGDEIPDLINKIYSYQNYADLAFENVSAVMNGRYLSANMTIRNSGLKDSEDFKIKIYADNRLVREMNSTSVKIGEGKIILLQHVLTFRTSVDELKFLIDANFEELEKENNQMILRTEN